MSGLEVQGRDGLPGARGGDVLNERDLRMNRECDVGELMRDDVPMLDDFANVVRRITNQEQLFADICRKYKREATRARATIVDLQREREGLLQQIAAYQQREQRWKARVEECEQRWKGRLAEYGHALREVEHYRRVAAMWEAQNAVLVRFARAFADGGASCEMMSPDSEGMRCGRASGGPTVVKTEEGATVVEGSMSGVGIRGDSEPPVRRRSGAFATTGDTPELSRPATQTKADVGATLSVIERSAGDGVSALRGWRTTASRADRDFARSQVTTGAFCSGSNYGRSELVIEGTESDGASELAPKDIRRLFGVLQQTRTVIAENDTLRLRAEKAQRERDRAVQTADEAQKLLREREDQIQMLQQRVLALESHAERSSESSVG